LIRYLDSKGVGSVPAAQERIATQLRQHALNEAVCTLRQKIGWTQEELATALEAIGESHVERVHRLAMHDDLEMGTWRGRTFSEAPDGAREDRGQARPPRFGVDLPGEDRTPKRAVVWIILPEVFAERAALGRQAPSELSESARRVWDQMRDGRIQNAVACSRTPSGGLV
jgi:hypothetical protein